MAQCPPGHDTLVGICYSFTSAKRQGVSVFAREESRREPDGRANAAHQRKVNAAIACFISKQSDMIMSKCPPEHALVVKVTYKFVPVHTTSMFRGLPRYGEWWHMEQWIANRKRSAVRRAKPFTKEHFDALLELRLTEGDRRLVNISRRTKQTASLRELRPMCREPESTLRASTYLLLPRPLLRCRQTSPLAAKSRQISVRRDAGSPAELSKRQSR